MFTCSLKILLTYCMRGKKVASIIIDYKISLHYKEVYAYVKEK